MIYNLTETDRIASNPTGGFDWQTADIDKKTGKIRTNPKTGSEVWSFHEFHPKLEKLLESYVMQTAPVMDDTLNSAYQIMGMLRAEFAKLHKAFAPLGRELDAVTQERDRLKEQLKSKKVSVTG